MCDGQGHMQSFVGGGIVNLLTDADTRSFSVFQPMPNSGYRYWILRLRF
jgi:hypothetical protein